MTSLDHADLGPVDRRPEGKLFLGESGGLAFSVAEQQVLLPTPDDQIAQFENELGWHADPNVGVALGMNAGVSQYGNLTEGAVDAEQQRLDHPRQRKR